MNNRELIIFMPSIEGGGVEKNLFIISNYLSSKIKNITLISSSNKYNKKFKRIKFLSPFINLENFKSRKLKYFFCLMILIKKVLFKKNYLVFAFQANLYSILVCKVFGVKIITRSNTSPEGWSNNLFKKFLYKKIIKMADSIIVNSKDFKKKFKERFNINPILIYNPLNKKEIIKKSKFKSRKIFDTNISLKIISVGRLVDQKDQITILKAINLIKNKLNFQLKIIGRGELKDKLVNFIYDNKLSKKVKIINFTINPYPLINQSNLFILSSKFEGLPNVLLEALTLKKFVISSNCPTGPREILLNGAGGILFKIGDYKDLAKKIFFFEKNKNKLSTKMEYAYKKLIRFDYQKNLDKYYKSVKGHLST